MPSLIPDDALPVKINNFRTPASVWATEVARDGMSKARLELYKLEQRLSSEINKKRVESVSFREVQEIVAVRSLHDGRLWHRGKIECRMELMSGPRYRIHLLDHGMTVRAKPDQVRNLPFKCDDLPPQALTLILEGIVPANLELSSSYDSFQSEVCSEWTPSAEKFVEDINKDHDQAYFVEKKGYYESGQTRYGDLLIIMRNGEEPFSLSKLLCERKHAKYCREIFKKRQIIAESNVDAPELCHSPLPIDSSTDSCSSSPAAAMMTKKMSNQDIKKEPMRMGEFLQEVGRQKSTVTTHSAPQKTTKSSSDTESDQSKGKFGRSALFAKIKESCKSSINGIEEESCKSSNIGTHEESRENINYGAQGKQTASQPRVYAPTLPSKAANVRLVPAGFNLTYKETATRPKPRGKSDWENSTDEASSHPSNSHRSFSTKSSESDEFLSFKERNYAKPVSSGLGQQSNKSRLPQTEAKYHSDSSISDSSSNRKSDSHQQATVIAESHRNCPRSSNTSDNLESSDNSLSPRKQPMSIKNLSQLIKESKQPVELKPTDPANERATPVKKTSISWTDSQSKVDPASLMRNRILRAPMTAVCDDDTLSEDYLARSVLLHGGFPPKPWMSFNDLKLRFSSHIEKYLLEKRWCFDILTLQKFMWPAIQQRQNVVMVSPKKSGKTTSYVIPLMDFMISLEDTPKGNGPLVIILCSGSQTAIKVYEECVKSIRSLKKPPLVHVVYGLAIEKRTIIDLINGCEVFVTTPPCLLRMLKDPKFTYAINFHRLCHYVLDEADVIMTRFLDQVKEIQAILVAEQSVRTKKCEDKDPIQIIVSSEKWEPRLLSFSEHLRGNPLLCINDCFEACVYGKPDVVFHLTQAENKPSKLLQVLRDIAGLQKVVLFCDETEVAKLEEFLQSDCMNCLVVNPHAPSRHLEAILSCWNSSKAGEHYVLLCTDSDFEDLKIQDASCTVHYSLPTKDRSFFVKRLSSLLKSIPNRFEEKVLKISQEMPSNLTPSIHLLMDESNSEQLPVIVQLMQRVSGKLEKKLLETAEAITMKKEKKMKVNKLFCRNLKMFGQCWKMGDCPSRHVYIPEIDVCEDLPSSGVVSMQVIHVHSAGHYSVRLLEHIQGKTKREWPPQYRKLGFMMSAYYSKQENRILITDINVGDIFAVETDAGLYQRVQVLDILEQDPHGNPSSLQVHFLDEGHQNTVKAYMLHHLSEELKAFPAQVVDVYLCGLLPADQDSDYGRDANVCVRKWTKCSDDDKDSKEKLLQGKIVMSMTGSLWIDPLNIIELLPHTQTYVVRRNIGQSLLQERHALENHHHMANLFKLCGKDASVLSVVTAKVKCSEPQIQPKPDWAFLESDVFQDVEFICAEDVSVIFVRREKFNSLLKQLIEDIGKKTPPRRHEEALLLSVGSYCLAQYMDDPDPKWHRVKIISKNEDDSFTVFYVDHGDTQDVSIELLKSIPDWAITRLPFQAIECSLAGISSCDNVDKLYDITNSGGKHLVAKVRVCERHKDAKHTGGSHFVVVVVDCSKPDPSILNQDLLNVEGVEPREDQLEYLQFEIDSSLFNRITEESDQEDVVNQVTDLNLSDLEFKEEDLSPFLDADSDNGFGNFEVFGLEELAKDFQKNNKSIVEEAWKGMHSKAQSEVEQLGKALPASADSKLNGNDITAEVKLEHTHGKSGLKADEVQHDDSNTSAWEEEVEYFGRCNLPVLCCARPPRIKWFEDLYNVWIKICLTGVEKFFLQWTYDSIQFSTTVRDQHYHFNQQLRGVIFPGSVVLTVKGFTVDVKMKKVLSGELWGRLFSTKRRLHWVSRDLEATAADSSDSDCGVSLGAINKEIRKIPLKHRRRPIDKYMKGKPIKPDIFSESEKSCSDYERIDSDEMF